jgi:hypothetical protein
MTPEQQTAFAAAYLELFNAEMIDADRPEAHLKPVQGYTLRPRFRAYSQNWCPC